MSDHAGNERSAFVTGAAGFLGRHLVEVLSRDGWRVIAFCLPTDRVDVLRPVADVVLGDITDAGSVRAAIPKGVDAIFHAAGDTSTWSRHAARQHTVNVVGTTNVIEAALQRSAARLIYTSSISAYGYQPGVRISEGTPSSVMTKGTTTEEASSTPNSESARQHQAAGYPQ